MSGNDNDKYFNLLNNEIGEFEVSSPIKPFNCNTSFFDEVKFIPFNQPEECPICYCNIDEKNGKSTTECGHTFCSKCFAATMQRSVACPLCRKNLTQKVKEQVEVPIPFFDNESENEITTEVFRSLFFNTSYFKENLAKSVRESMGPRPLTQEKQKMEIVIIEKIISQNSFWDCFQTVSREACYGTANWFYNFLTVNED